MYLVRVLRTWLLIGCNARIGRSDQLRLKFLTIISWKAEEGVMTLERPYIICHMLTSLDGKIIGDYLNVERAAYFTDEYEKIHGRYGCKAWMCGRVTMEEHFTFGHQLDLKQDNIPTIPRIDYVANKDAKTYVIAVDPSGIRMNRKFNSTMECV
jgi:hypothetical protein